MVYNDTIYTARDDIASGNVRCKAGKKSGRDLKKKRRRAMLSKMKLLRNIAPAAAALLLTAAGCNSTPVRQEERAMEPPTPAQKATVERRAAALRRALSPLKVRGVGVPLSSYRHRIFPSAEVMKMVRQLGFNRCTATFPPKRNWTTNSGGC